MSSELRVFISSTFQDLQEERSYLMKHVFPEIRMLCRERGIEFTEIDLRWGLTHEEGTLGKIIRTCFEEIDKCRPFFIGILGTRYGWVPRYLDIQKDPELLRKYPWIEEEVLESASLLELEFMHGVLAHDGDLGGSFFYVRDTTPASALDDERPQIERLLERMRASSRPVRSYHDTAALGAQVRSDMLAAIDHYWPVETRNTRVAVERRSHEAFSAARRHAYIAKPENIRLLNRHAAGVDAPLAVVADSGMGKSALLAYWSNAYRRKYPGAFVITHFVGAAANGSTAGDVVRRILGEIKERTGWTDDIPVKNHELTEALPLWLARLQEPMVLVIDAVNQLDERSHDLSWLPSYIPPHIRVVLSMTPGESSAIMEARGWNHLALTPLTPEERETLVVRFLSEYRKGLSTDQCALIANGERCANPLFLRTVLEELRLLGYFEELDAHLVHYLASRDLIELFQRVLKRMEDDFGPATMRSVMGSIWASRDGLSEAELMDVAVLSRAECSRLLIALDYHLMQREGRRTFFHEYLRRAVEVRYLPTVNLRTAAHSHLGEYFATVPPGRRSLDEEPWQWRAARNGNRLTRWLTDIPNRIDAMREENQWDTIGYWESLEAVEAKGDLFLKKVIDAVEQELPSARIDTLRIAGQFAMECGWLNASATMLSSALSAAEVYWGVNAPETAGIEGEVGNVMRAQGAYGEALEHLLRAANVLTAAYGREHPETLRSMSALASAQSDAGAAEAACDTAREVLRIAENLYPGNSLELVGYRETLGIMLYRRHQLEEAEACFRAALHDVERGYGMRHPKAASQLTNLAAVLKDRGEHAASVDYARRALAIFEATLGERHPLTISGMINVGALARVAGNYDVAENMYARALSAKRQVYGEGHVELATILHNLGALAMERNELDKAESFAAQALEILQRSRPEGHLDLAFPLSVLAGVRRKRGMFADAAVLYRRALDLRIKAHGANDSSLRRILQNYLAVIEELGDVEEAARIHVWLDSLSPAR